MSKIEFEAYSDDLEEAGSIRTAPAYGQWQPIETAPRDGRRILAHGLLGYESKNGIGTVSWDAHYKCFCLEPNEATEYDPEKCELTHWMPLPPPPGAIDPRPHNFCPVCGERASKDPGHIHTCTLPDETEKRGME